MNFKTGPAFPSRSLSQESSCLGMKFNFTIDQKKSHGGYYSSDQCSSE